MAAYCSNYGHFAFFLGVITTRRYTNPRLPYLSLLSCPPMPNLSSLFSNCYSHDEYLWQVSLKLFH